MESALTTSPLKMRQSSTAMADLPVAVGPQIMTTFVFSIKGDYTIRTLKKSIHGFFNTGLSEVNSAKPHKLLDLDSLAIMSFHPWIAWQVVFNNLLFPARLCHETDERQFRRAVEPYGDQGYANAPCDIDLREPVA